MQPNVVLVCSQISVADTYAADLVGLLAGRGAHVHVVALTNWGKPPAEVADARGFQEVRLPATNLLPASGATCWALANRTQAGLEALVAATKSRWLVYVARDADVAELPIARRPAGVACSVFVLQLNYANVPRATRDSARHFTFVVAAGHNAADALARWLPDKPRTTVFPRLLQPALGVPAPPSPLVRKALGLREDKFVFLADVNLCLELKAFDTLVTAYVHLLATVPDFKRHALLLVNAMPSLQLDNVLKLHPFTPNELAVFVPYYQQGLNRDERMLQHVVCAADVVVNCCAGSDFDPHANLAQRYGKLVIYNDAMHGRDYYPFGLRVGTSQKYYDGLAQGFLHLPSAAELARVMLQAFQARDKLRFSEKVRQKVDAFARAHDRFDQGWEDVLDGAGL